MPPKTRFEEFEIERVLAQSSFAVVYRAYDHALKMHVALKEYLPDALALRSAETQVVLRARAHADRFGQGLQAFIAEAQTLARCDHPALVRITRLLQRHGTAYRVMRYSPGPTLLAHRRELSATPDVRALRGWLDGLLGALEALHEEGCVHGAVAPGNILLRPDGRPLLLDFDAVRTALISDRTQSMMAALEPCFEPPEQQVGIGEAALGPWSDLYSLAATLHFCISGQLPAAPSGPVPARPPEPLGMVWVRLRAAQPALGDPPGWLSVLDDCLAERPQDRLQSVAEVRARLDGLAPPAAPPPAASVPTLTLPVVPPVAARAPVAPPPPPAKPPAVEPPPPPKPSDPAHAKVMADLDQTFAFIAAQANEDAAKPRKEGDAPADSAPATAYTAAGPEAPDAEPAAVPPLSPQRRLALLVAAALLLLVLMGGAVVWMLKAYDPGLLGGSAASPFSVPPADAAQPLVYPPPSAGRPQADGGMVSGAAPPVIVDPPKPAPPPAPAAPAKVAAGPSSPRQACGNRERYALLQCMETQCAKKAWTQHEQCVRLRKERKL